MAAIIGPGTHVDNLDVDLDEVKLEAEKYERPKDDQNVTMQCINILAVCERQMAALDRFDTMIGKLEDDRIFAMFFDNRNHLTDNSFYIVDGHHILNLAGEEFS